MTPTATPHPAPRVVGRLAQDVFHALGGGLTECIYQTALAHALRAEGFSVEVERTLPVYFHDVQVGAIRADLVVNGHVVVELKACGRLNESHVAQLRAYLLRLPEAAAAPVGVLVNFGLGGTDSRLVHTADSSDS